MDDDPVIKAIKDDLSLVIEALDQEKFTHVISIGNGIVDNISMAQRKEYLIYGLFIQEVAEEFLFIKRRNKDELNDSKDIGTSFVKNLIFLLDEELDVSKIWKEYFNFKKEISKHNKSELELLVYKGDNAAFTSIGTSMLINHLQDNKELLIQEDNGLIYGILNELMRLHTLYGFENRDLIFYVLLVALTRYYYVFSRTDLKNIEDTTIIEKRIYPYIEQLLDLVKTEDVEFNESSNELIGDIYYNSTIYFINYLAGSNFKDNNEKDNKMKLIPKKSREKIGKVLEEAIEKEMKK